MFIPGGFELYELFPKWFYQSSRGIEPYKLWGVFDNRLLFTMDRLRKRYGPMVANDWYWDGVNNYRGWRPTDCEVGAEFSQHKYGRAVDLKPVKVSVDEIREDILADPFHEDFKYIACLEMGVSWLHLDVRNHDKAKYGILLVYP